MLREFFPGRLIVLEDAAGPRHYLDGRPVTLGDVLEVKVGDEWIAVRYHWVFRLDVEPTFLPLDDERLDVELPPASSASFRWPRG